MTWRQFTRVPARGAWSTSWLNPSSTPRRHIQTWRTMRPRTRQKEYCLSGRKWKSLSFKRTQLLSSFTEIAKCNSSYESHTECHEWTSVFTLEETQPWYQILHANSCYCQIEVKIFDRDKASFIFNHGLYQFWNMSLGLTNVCEKSKRTMNLITFLCQEAPRLCLFSRVCFLFGRCIRSPLNMLSLYWLSYRTPVSASRSKSVSSSQDPCFT